MTSVAGRHELAPDATTASRSIRRRDHVGTGHLSICVRVAVEPLLLLFAIRLHVIPSLLIGNARLE